MLNSATVLPKFGAVVNMYRTLDSFMQHFFIPLTENGAREMVKGVLLPFLYGLESVSSVSDHYDIFFLKPPVKEFHMLAQ